MQNDRNRKFAMKSVCKTKENHHYLQFADFWMYRNFEAVRYDANRIPSNVCNRRSWNMTICGDSKSIADLSVCEEIIENNFIET